MATKKVIGFYSHIPSLAKKQTGMEWYYCFSNWAWTPYTVKGVNYIASEQMMMEQKALLFGDKEIAKKVMDLKPPANMSPLNYDQDWQPYNSILAKIKALGREVKNFDSKVWDEKRFDIVYQANVEKFKQNKEIADTLLSTKDWILAEASPSDKIWGIGLSPNDPDVQNPAKWRGKNLLGEILMKVRAHLRETQKK
eukprot:Phypoly_transcript_19995.p1 GENE.Phypoly_transcript_19995~~Phypoly_transcript_19995.p1  ORF type:complete len:211 (+),score=33.61 Phypoly_transcript_19995:48-635(+)